MNPNKLLAATAAALLSAAVIAESEHADFDWLTGHWCADRNGDFIEEVWLPARGDAIFGLSRTIKGDKTKNFEYMRIVQGEQGTVFIAQPQGSPPTEFRLTASGVDWARFENPAHDFPNRVEYRRKVGSLHAEISGPGRDGKTLVIPFEYAICNQ